MAARPTFAELAGRLLNQQRSTFAKGGAGGPGGGKSPKFAALGGTAGILALTAGGFVLNSAIFNGQSRFSFFSPLPSFLRR